MLWPTGKVPEIPDSVPSNYSGLYKATKKEENVNFGAIQFLLQEKNKEEAAKALVEL